MISKTKLGCGLENKNEQKKTDVKNKTENKKTSNRPKKYKSIKNRTVCVIPLKTVRQKGQRRSRVAIKKKITKNNDLLSEKKVSQKKKLTKKNFSLLESLGLGPKVKQQHHRQQ